MTPGIPAGTERRSALRAEGRVTHSGRAEPSRDGPGRQPPPRPSQPLPSLRRARPDPRSTVSVLGGGEGGGGGVSRLGSSTAAAALPSPPRRGGGRPHRQGAPEGRVPSAGAVAVVGGGGPRRGWRRAAADRAGVCLHGRLLLTEVISRQRVEERAWAGISLGQILKR